MKKRTKTKIKEALTADVADVKKKVNGEDHFSDSDAMIDLEILEKMAAEADQAAEEPEDEEPRRGRRRNRSLKDLREESEDTDIGPEQDEGKPVPIAIEYDPEFEIMITSLVGDAVMMCRDSMQWSDPGRHWKEKVGGCLARIVQKRITKGRQIADEVVLLGYLALWIGPNVANGFGRHEDTIDIGHDGQRQDVSSPSIS